MKRTKIVCTMGPNSDKPGMLESLVDAGMDVARFNFSHGDHAEHKERMDRLKAIRREKKIPVAHSAGYQGAGDPDRKAGGRAEGNPERGRDPGADHGGYCGKCGAGVRQL